MEKFRLGDFIRLKNVAAYQINRVSGGEINIFEINNIEPEYVEVNGCNEKIPISEIKSIPINGVDDNKIYCHFVMASYDDPVPVFKTDYSYYFDSLKNFKFEDKYFQIHVQEQDLKFVHEVQHFLSDQIGHRLLEINLQN